MLRLFSLLILLCGCTVHTETFREEVTVKRIEETRGYLRFEKASYYFVTFECQHGQFVKEFVKECPVTEVGQVVLIECNKYGEYLHNDMKVVGTIQNFLIVKEN